MSDRVAIAVVCAWALAFFYGWALARIAADADRRISEAGKGYTRKLECLGGPCDGKLLDCAAESIELCGHRYEVQLDKEGHACLMYQGRS